MKKMRMTPQEMMETTSHLDKEFDREFPDRNLDKEKQELIQNLKTIKKEQLFEVKRYTLWQKIRKTLGL